MSKLRVGVVSYGSRGAAIADALARSEHKPQVYIASKQANPMNIATAERTGGKHIVADLSYVEGLASFFKENVDSFVFPGPETPIIAGLYGSCKKHGIPVLAPAKGYAVEDSKKMQRRILDTIAPEANPRVKVFPGKQYTEEGVKDWLAELDYQVAIKPSSPTAGKGVGVSGDHFEPTEGESYAYFQEVARDSGFVVIEEKLDGEESSLQAFSDGKTLRPLPDVRDYKRAFPGDKGPNTGGMGSYCDARPWLPFMTSKDRREEMAITQKVFNYLRVIDRNKEMLGVPFYMAFIHTGKGPKVLEINSRLGDPEGMNILPIFESDFMELCFDMLSGNLYYESVLLAPKATVVIYKVPPTYGGKESAYEGSREVDLTKAMKMAEYEPEHYRVYPGDMALEGGKTYAIKSRTVACVGIGDDIEEARCHALELIESVEGGGLWFREDIASREHIWDSIDTMDILRG